MSIVAIQQAAVDAIKAAIPSLAQCEIYGGQLEGEHGQRVAIFAPSVLVTVQDFTPISDPGIAGQMDVKCKLSAFVIAKYANDKIKREGSCIDLAQAVSIMIHNNNFALPHVGLARITGMRGLTSAAVNEAGYSIWSVSWTQELRIGQHPISNFGTLKELWAGQKTNLPKNTVYQQL